MLRQNKSQIFMPVLIAFVLSLCSFNAFSTVVRKIEFIRKIKTDTDTYIIATAKSVKRECIDKAWPLFVKMTPEDASRQFIYVRYLQAVEGCGILRSAQPFEVQSKEHPERMAQFLWAKFVGAHPSAIIHRDSYGLLSFDNKQDNILKVYIGYDGRSQ